MNIKIGFVFLILFSFQFNSSKINIQSYSFFQVKNNTPFVLSKISLYSIKFDSLNPNQKSQIERLKFNKNKDDAMLYLTVKDKHFTYYLDSDLPYGKTYTFQIDSLNFKTHFTYLTILSK